MTNLIDQVLEEAMDKIFPKDVLETQDSKTMYRKNWTKNNLREALALHSKKVHQLIDGQLKDYDLMKEPCRREDNTCKEAFELSRTIDMCFGCEYNFQVDWKIQALKNLKEKLKE